MGGIKRWLTKWWLELVLCAFAFAVLVVASWESGLGIDKFKDHAQVIFWTCATVLGWLTYINTRKGTLQPIRTEVFKSQIEALKAVQALFGTTGEIELRDRFGQAAVLQVNTRRFVADYSKVLFGMAYTTERMTVGDAWHPLNASIQRDIQIRKWLDAAEVPAAERKEFWTTYKSYGLEIPMAFIESQKRISLCLEHPLLPTSVRIALEQFRDRVNGVLHFLPTVLTHCATEMTTRFPDRTSLDTIVNGETAEVWVSNCYCKFLAEDESARFLKPHADAVLKSIRDYLQVDGVMRS